MAAPLFNIINTVAHLTQQQWVRPLTSIVLTQFWPRFKPITSPNDERMYYVLHYSFDYDPPFYLILTDYDGSDSRIRWVNATLWTIIHTSGFAHIIYI